MNKNKIHLNEFLKSMKTLAAQLGYKLVRTDIYNELIKNNDDMNFVKSIDEKFQNKAFQLLRDSKSQFRQDLFTLAQLGFKRNGYFVEFGAADGLVSSNSYLLEREFGWEGILAEPALFWHDGLKRNRSANIETKCVWRSTGEQLLFNETNTMKQLSTLDSFNGADGNGKFRTKGHKYLVETISLLDLLRKYDAPAQIDYLSIDTEGSEYEILKDFDFNKYSFNVITCEHNYSPIRNEIYTLLISKGYKRTFTEFSKVDDWYVLETNTLNI